ncbi:hypothetical protein IM40_11350 (plasmid) [Candidatus Paracaedimonas acanthamoebae]|nr:hypothetical protein IM40_11350 [Candidatus Paracaedimonas acanthamoebae]
MKVINPSRTILVGERYADRKTYAWRDVVILTKNQTPNFCPQPQTTPIRMEVLELRHAHGVLLSQELISFKGPN